MEAAMMTMISALFVAVLGSVWNQARENAKIRDLIQLANNETRADVKDLRREVKDLGGEVTGLSIRVTALEVGVTNLGDQYAELKRATEKNHNETRGSLAEVRERLARIEGHLKIGNLPPAEPAAGE